MIRFLFLVLFLTASTLCYSHSSIVYNYTDNVLEYGEDMNKSRPIASLTKLMTALLIVESNLDLTEEVKYKGGIWRTSMVSRQELLDSLLIRSDNAAGDALANSWPGGRNYFIKAMNGRAEQLGMTQTKFFDPHGLDKRNISSAKDLARLIIEDSKHKLIANISTTKYLMIERKNKKKISYVSIGNTNKTLLFEFDEIILSKTGWTNPAGRCLALMVQKGDKKYAIVILGELTPKDREEKARQLIFNYATINETEKDRYENRFHLFHFN
jgi:D-alanyl-D-alanine endopeptidase (penicillin-binding protein 7)